MGDRVIINGYELYPGHKLAWRSGTFCKTGHAVCGNVVLDLVGRERKQKIVSMPPCWLLKETPELIEKLRASGLMKPQ